MNDNTSLSTFPRNAVEALTMLYLQNQDLSVLSPEELVDTYKEISSKIHEKLNSTAKLNSKGIQRP